MEPQPADLWKQITEGIAARNGAIELSAVNTESDHQPVRYFRSRLLALGEDTSMVVERPSTPGTSAAMAIGNSVDVTVMHQGKRWCATAQVLGPAKVTLRQGLTVPALRLSPARNVRSGQRRRYYRVEVKGLDFGEVILTREGSEESGAEGIGIQPANLSAGGLGARVLNKLVSANKIERGETFGCVLHVPSLGSDMKLRAKLVHVMPGSEGHTYLGFEFVFDTPLQERRIQDELGRWVTELERRQLRRLRGAG